MKSGHYEHLIKDEQTDLIRVRTLTGGHTLKSGHQPGSVPEFMVP